ncbi:MAG: hypothetical protein ACJ8GJ_07220 [Vitreoscilla sp.]
MECFKLTVPEDTRLRGRTVTGQPVAVYPGEYLAHLLWPKADPRAPAILRLVGADALGRDVHVPLEGGAGQQKGPAGPGSTGRGSDQLAAIIRPGPRCEAPEAE